MNARSPRTLVCFYSLSAVQLVWAIQGRHSCSSCCNWVSPDNNLSTIAWQTSPGVHSFVWTFYFRFEYCVWWLARPPLWTSGTWPGMDSLSREKSLEGITCCTCIHNYGGVATDAIDYYRSVGVAGFSYTSSLLSLSLSGKYISFVIVSP